ncbi:MAG TPA: protein kinase [Kofleriaceae bacterium]|nr:protein kinase [Kofleriaceae bacterium]
MTDVVTDDDLDGDVDDADSDAFLREVARVDDLPPPDGELRAGDRLAHFVIGARLGAGSMGAVYEARDEKLGRTVAIKVMRRTTDEARARFLQEARAAAAVSHPNLVTVHEIGEDAGRAFIVMERIRGKTLRGVRASSAREAVDLLTAIAAGLAAAHAAGVVHRDLKPDNVMRTEDGAIKVLDFGIARLTDDSALAIGTPPMTGTGLIVGTPSYMSPEQAAGEPVDARSDIYSFGVVARELIFGARAPKVPPGEPGSLPAILDRCVRDARDERYANGREVHAALSTLSAKLEARRTPRSRSLVWLVCALVGLVGIGIAWRVTRSSTPPAAPRVKPRALAAAADLRTTNTQARDAYVGAFTALHDAQFFEAVRGFERAVELDPGFAAAHLRLGLAKRWFHSKEEGRTSFAFAVKHRDELDARDRGLLEAAEPAVMREPFDYAESQKRFSALLAIYPDDTELMYWLGWTYGELGEHEQLMPLLDRMAAVDPTAAVVMSSRALTLFYLGDLRGAREAAIECRRIAPTQGTCAFELQKILDDAGACDELETVLRAWMIASPDEPRAPHALARLLLATRRPREAVDEMFEQARSRLPEAQRAAAKLDDDDAIAFATGDFTQAPPDHGPVRNALDRIDLAFETGNAQLARRTAEQFLAKSSAFSQGHGSSDGDLFGDPTGAILATLARTGAITREELQHKRDAWVHELDASIGGNYHRMIWAHGYADTVATADEAAGALAALPRYEPLPATYWFPFVYGRIGRTFVLGGRPADAMPYLERATKRCMERDPRDFLYLGLAHQALGQSAEACSAFGEVVTRWGNAKPRSVTAEKARQQMAALACAPRG